MDDERYYLVPPDEEIPETMEQAVSGLLSDLPRRLEDIVFERRSAQTRALYQSINDDLFYGLDTVEEQYRAAIFDDIVAGVGYEDSDLFGILPEEAYNRRRRAVVYYAAHALGWV